MMKKSITKTILGHFALCLVVITLFPTNHSSVKASTPLPWDGVPDLPINYATDVKSWWDTHPFNSESPAYRPEIASPTNQIDVLNEFNGNIQSAIDSLPASGGTLIFPEATYSGTFRLVGKKNIHFLGQGNPIIRLTAEIDIAGCEEATNYATISAQVAKKNPTAITCVTSGRTHNLYFNSLTFDGQNTLLDGINLAAAKDIIFDNVVFQNFVDPREHHRGLVSGNAVLDNIWFRNTTFAGNERYALYLDGLHGGGVINSTVNGKFGSGGFLFLTNDDLSRDYDNSGSIDINEQRTGNHIVVANNTFTTPLYSGIAASGRDILVINNNFLQSVQILADFDSKSSNIDPKLTYQFFNNQVLFNKTKNVKYLAEVASSPTCPKLINCAKQGKYMVIGNTVENSNIFSKLVNEVPNQYGTIEGPNTVINNCINNPLCVTVVPTPSISPTPTPTPTPSPTPSPLPSPPTNPGNNNIIINSSFELGSFPWSLNKAVLDTSTFVSGSTSLKIAGPADIYTRQFITLLPSTTYTMSYWVKTQNIVSKGLAIRMVQIEPSVSVIGLGEYVKGSTDWVKKSLTFTTPAKFISGRIDILYTLATGELGWVDDVTLCEGFQDCQ